MKKKIITAGIAGAAIAAGLGFAVPAGAAPDPCSYNGPATPDGPDNSICGLPGLQASVDASLARLAENLDPARAAAALQGNLNPAAAGANLKANTDVGAGLGNLQHALTHGVGEEG